MSVTVRPAAVQDATAVGRLIEQFAEYLRDLGDTDDLNFSQVAYVRDRLGPNPAFQGLIAELEETVVGYLPYHFGYDTDRAGRNLHVIDLYVGYAGSRSWRWKSLDARGGPKLPGRRRERSVLGCVRAES